VGFGCKKTTTATTTWIKYCLLHSIIVFAVCRRHVPGSKYVPCPFWSSKLILWLFVTEILVGHNYIVGLSSSGLRPCILHTYIFKITSTKKNGCTEVQTIVSWSNAGDIFFKNFWRKNWKISKKKYCVRSWYFCPTFYFIRVSYWRNQEVK